MTKPLRPILGNLNRPILRIYRGILDDKGPDQAQIGIEEINVKIKFLKNALHKIFPDQVPDSLQFTLTSIDYIMYKLKYWYDRNELLNNFDAEVFMDGFKYNKMELLELLEEIDNEREIQGLIV